ncbi:MAG: hypothetical protein FWD25_13800 [Clostridia bacterium]|nr:hypothetical protein [Clostridia bacterium]
MIKKLFVACCLLFCWYFGFVSLIFAEGYTLSLPRIEATYCDETFSSPGGISYQYHNSQWPEWLDITELVNLNALPGRITIDTLEMAEEKLCFSMVRPTYLPEELQFRVVRVEGYESVGIYYSVLLYFGHLFDPPFIELRIIQDYVGPKATLELKTDHLIKPMEYEGQTYLCTIFEKENYASMTLHWLEDDFCFRVEFTNVTNITYPYLEEALRVAASLTFAEE